MCPEPKIISIYLDGELPSPWKEKMETHLAECSVCRGKYENFKRLQELFRKDNNQKRTIVEHDNLESDLSEDELMKASMEKVWQNLESSCRRYERQVRSRKTIRQNKQVSSFNLWQRRLSIPLPAAAAAAVIIVLITAMWFRNPAGNNGLASIPVDEPAERTSLILAAEHEVPNIMPAMDMNSVLQYLNASGGDIIILQLPESNNFLRSGEPEMIRAADYKPETNSR